MPDIMITPQQQKLILEKLYRSSDAIRSTEKFNHEYGHKVGEMGISSLKITDFARKMKRTHFISRRVENATKQVTGKDVDIETL